MERDDELFEAAAALSQEARRAFLATACRGDEARLARIEELLQAHDRSADFMNTPPVVRPPLSIEEKEGDVIDRYKLLQRIGEGGVGVVWMARQEQPLRRLVAVKIIKLGMDTKAVVARFDTERQALALMDHPSIATVFDAGVTGTGRPYFVMELVRGTPITKYCDEHRHSLRQRLDLFIAVCEAVHHAHQKGVIHRDLKPSNILVTENGGLVVPKVIDFGIAKAAQGRLGDRTVVTAFEQFVGTPAYMSPEQADQSGSIDIDTRSDIYSLGVVLFELLTGYPPFESGALLKGGIEEIRRRIREEDPKLPSVRVAALQEDHRTTVARQRSLAASRLRLELRGDLDWIVMRCLEKERTRRYESASALAEDLRRHLRNEPVVARPPGTLYVLGKLIRRNRVAFAGMSTVALLVFAGGGLSAWQAVRATRAEREQARLRAIESELRQKAEAQERDALLRGYAADMMLVQQALTNDNLGLARRLLDRHRPQAGAPDLRGWEWRYLWLQSRSEAASTLARMPHQVSSLSVSHDGRWLAISQTDGGVLPLQNFQTRQTLSLEAGVGAVRAAFSPARPLLAIAFTAARAPQSEYRVRLWDLVERRTISEWTIPHSPGALFFSGDGDRLIVAGNRTGQNSGWRVPSGASLGPSTAVGGLNAGGGSLVAYTRDLRLLARQVSRSDRGRLEVVEVATGRELWSAEASDEDISALAFSADGSVLASAAGNSGSSITLWKVSDGERLGRLSGHRTYVTHLLFWPDGRTLASAGTDQTVRLWNVEARSHLRTLRGHELEVHSLALLADGTTLVSGSKDGTVLIWDTATPQESPQTRIDAVANWRFLADDAIVLLDENGAVIRRGGAHFERAETLFDLGVSFAKAPHRAKLAPNAPLIAFDGGGGTVRIIDWERRQPAIQVETGASRVSVVGFTSDSKRLLLVHDDPASPGQKLHEWDFREGKRIRSWSLFAGSSYGSSLSTDGRRCSYRGPDGVLRVVDLVSGAERALPGIASNPGAQLTAPQFSPDGKRFAVASWAGWAQLWDFEGHRLLAELSGFVLGVHATAFSPDGARLLTGSGGAEAVRLWNSEDHEALLSLSATGTIFNSIAFSPGGNSIGARNAQGRLHLWRAPSWAQIEAAESRRP